MVFVGEGASNESGVVENYAFRFFRSLYLLKYHKAIITCITVICVPLVAFH